MRMFLSVALVFGIFVGSIFGAMFTSNMKGFKKIFGMIATIIIIGCIISSMFCMEVARDERFWNNGNCSNCDTQWTFTNADRNNSGTSYYYTCTNCGDIIKLNRNFKK